MRWIVEQEISVVRVYEVDAQDMEGAIEALKTATPIEEIDGKGRLIKAVPRSEYKPRTPKKKAAAPRSARATRIPPDYKPDIDYGLSLGVARRIVERQAMDFRDYWAARPGQGGTKLDWHATWRTWIRRTADKIGAVPPVPKATTGAKIILSKDDYARAVDLYRLTHNWNPAYGPAPQQDSLL